VSHEVEFAAVTREIDRFGERATLVSVGDGGAPHVVTTIVDVGDERLLVEVGSRTSENLRLRPRLSLVWEPSDGGEYQLILDGSAEQVGGPDERGVSVVTVAVDGGILHRLAGLPAGVPTCRALGQPVEA
jgi:hypothetical protein